MLEVYEEYRRRGIAESLEAYMINYHLSKGYLPYGDVIAANSPSFNLQRKLGLKITSISAVLNLQDNSLKYLNPFTVTFLNLAVNLNHWVTV